MHHDFTDEIVGKRLLFQFQENITVNHWYLTENSTIFIKVDQ